MSDIENNERLKFLGLLQAMLDGRVSYFEGAAQVVELDRHLLGISESDVDFRKFELIRSETDHLPLLSQQSHWSADALENLKGEFSQTEEWAKTFARSACMSLIERLSN